MKFEAGDLVKLKGDIRVAPQIMSVESIDESGWIECIWFSESKIEKHKFRIESITLAYSKNPSLLTE